MADPIRIPTVTSPFLRFEALGKLTWSECFAFNRLEIMDNFVGPLMAVPGESQASTRKLACLLYAMMQQQHDISASTAILRDFVKPAGLNYPKVDLLAAEVSTSTPIGRVHWSPSGAPRLHVYCHTIFDLLGACLSEAAHLPALSPEQKERTKRNYFARLASLYSHWCFRLLDTQDQDRRPAKIGLACVGNVIVLGSCIPRVPQIPEGKEVIRKSRFVDLRARGRQEGSKKQILDPTKAERIAQDYGNCAETWTFALLCTLSEESLPKAFGVAVNIPQTLVLEYNEQEERDISRYAPLCVNCEKLMKQIVRWGAPGDKVVENFTAWRWTLHPADV
ncbi:uncharacterized protein BDR25DRAFT_346904 [Lindgomyces ingoldianus]|uniref:Uncharacterized protein n=1 Tax=Lindgomyces ingoldianus TaxID=673940 RepID=A0ACB6QB83_9PLEO|nr:uncharacterized protein BDR25DRAFT_346904 [Lindgomyces ingoldianus]KAF2464115.1 hypothetical protein BDR25DRAFT_346904 [Lindgomyces ingoldianus]